MVDGSCPANCFAYMLENDMFPKTTIFARYGLSDRMNDGFVEPPNRREWSLDILYEDWKTHGFLETLRKMGHITVSYAGKPYTDFVLADNNRHQILALSCFLDLSYATNARGAVKITAPHPQGGDFAATFSRFPEGIVVYTTENGTNVWFRFDSTLPSQI